MLKGPLVSLLLFTLTIPAYAQVDTKVYYNDKEVDPSADTLSGLLKSKENLASDSLYHLYDKLLLESIPSEKQLTRKFRDSLDTHTSSFEKNRQKADSIMALADADKLALPYQEVYSERMIKNYLDSIGADKLPGLPLKKEITDEELIQMVRDKFAPDVPAVQDSMTAGVAGLNDLSGFQLPPEALQELAPLTGQVVDSKYLEKLDSIRRINLEEQGLILKEKGVTEVSRITSFEEKETFWDKTYFEGILGLGDPEQFLVQITPALGYHFTDYSSVGLGPVIQVAEDSKGKALATIGFRPFFKQEFLKRHAYLQAEYMWKPVRQDIEQTTVTSGSFLGGGGVLVPVSSVIAANISVMYQVNKGEGAAPDVSPWVVRIGISTIKKVKE